MSATYDSTDDYTVCISDIGRAKLDDETYMPRVERLYTEIRLGALGGALLTIAGLVVKQIWSMT